MGPLDESCRTTGGTGGDGDVHGGPSKRTYHVCDGGPARLLRQAAPHGAETHAHSSVPGEHGREDRRGGQLN